MIQRDNSREKEAKVESSLFLAKVLLQLLSCHSLTCIGHANALSP